MGIIQTLFWITTYSRNFDHLNAEFNVNNRLQKVKTVSNLGQSVRGNQHKNINSLYNFSIGE